MGGRRRPGKVSARRGGRLYACGVRPPPLVLAVSFGLLAVACSEGGPPGNDGPEELEDIPEPDDVDMRIQLDGIELPPGEEVFWCYFGTMPETLAVTKMALRTNSPYIHHMLLKWVPEGVEYTDGTLVRCEELDDWYATAPTIFEAVRQDDEEEHDLETEDIEDDWYFQLPEGVAFEMEGDRGWIIDSHFINYGEEVAYADVAFDLVTIEMDEVEHWAGTFNHDWGELEIPPGGEFSYQFDCQWPADATVLSVGPHMHLFGVRYTVDWMQAEGGMLNLLNVPEWEARFREEAPISYFEDGEIQVSAGEAFRTTCTWDNDTDEVIIFPEEMCTTFGVGYPMSESVFCSADAGELTGQLRLDPSLTGYPGDAHGDVWVALLPEDPVAAGEEVWPWVVLRVEDVALGTAGAVVDYTLAGVPSRAEPFYVAVHLDDDDSGHVEGPTSGDFLYQLDDKGNLPTVWIEPATATTLDVSFNTLVP